MLLAAAALGAAAPAAFSSPAQPQPRAQPQPQARAPAQARARPAALPDLRILDIDAGLTPATDGATVTVVLTLHNASTGVAAGDIVIEAVHDRLLLQPRPIHHTVIYLSADELAEVQFTIPRVELRGSPYTVYTMVDATDAIEEADETNNTAWLRFDVCGDPAQEESADGRDNDCDGLVDEGLGIESGADEALAMLRTRRLRAERDGVPLVYATPSLPDGFARLRAVRLASEEGPLIKPPGPPPAVGRAGPAGGGAGGRGGRVGGGRGGRAPVDPPVGNVDATGSIDDPRALLQLTDWNGVELASGDRISLQDADGHFLVVDVLRDGRLETRVESRLMERIFTIIKVGDEAVDDPIIRSGDRVALAAPNRRLVHAEGGGGGPLRANREQVAGWETFTLTFEESGDDR